MDPAPVTLRPCDWLAQKWGWQLSDANVMVEGTSDARYFRLASEVYEGVTGLRLLSGELSLFAAGQGNDGGTYGITERFPTLHQLVRLDLDARGKRRYRVIALLDDDPMGRKAVIGMMAGNRSIVEFEHVFRLRRSMPRKANSSAALLAQTQASNAEFGELDCAIEDLVSSKLCDEYAAMFPQHRPRAPQVVGSGHHTKWEPAGKEGLLKHAESQATLDDVDRLIEVLKSLRSYVGLPPEGSN